MYQLVAHKEPTWLDLAPGIRGRFRHGASEALVFARRFTRAALELDDRADPEFYFIAGCVVWGLIEWEGVGDAEDQPAPLTADNVVALLSQRWDVFDEANGAYVEAIMALAAEKNASGSSPSGTSAGGKPSVTPAAIAPSAPIAKTTRARKRGSGSGPSSKAAPAS